MKIMIVGSTSFVKEMVEFREKLIALDHEVILHEHYIAWGTGQKPTVEYGGKSVSLNREKVEKKIFENEHAALKIANNYIKCHYQEILESEAILVLNLTKNGIDNYIGGNTLIEIGQAYVNDKKIFLLNPIPEISYRAEIEAMQPIILKNDLSKIN